MKFWAYKSKGKMAPATQEDKDKVAKIPNGEPVMLSYTKVRSGPHHRLYFAFLGKVYDNLPECLEYVEHPETKVMVKRWPKVHNFRKHMEMYAGHCEESITLKGEVRIEPKTIKYEELDETEFSELHNGVKNVIGRIITPKMDPDVFEKEVKPFY